MPKDISKAERLRIRKHLELCMRQAENAIISMTTVITGTTDSRRILKLKQALLSLKVEYNRIKMRYENEDN
jgi:hypothetical protein